MSETNDNSEINEFNRRNAMSEKAREWPPITVNGFIYIRLSEHEAKLAQLEKDLQEQCRINGIGAQRELRLETELRETEGRLEAETFRHWATEDKRASAEEMIGKMKAALVHVLNQPFQGDWDHQALFVQQILAELEAWRERA